MVLELTVFKGTDTLSKESQAVKQYRQRLTKPTKPKEYTAEISDPDPVRVTLDPRPFSHFSLEDLLNRLGTALLQGGRFFRQEGRGRETETVTERERSRARGQRRSALHHLQEEERKRREGRRSGERIRKVQRLLQSQRKAAIQLPTGNGVMIRRRRRSSHPVSL